MVAYLDLIILENLCMNFLILYTTGRLLNRNYKIVRLLIASIIGDLYTFSLYFDVPSYVLNISKLLIALILVKIAFNSKTIKSIIKESLVFFMVSFIYAGCTLGFIYLFKPKVLYIVNGVIIGGEYIFELVVVSAVISFLLIKISMRIVKLKQRFFKKDMLCSIKVINNKNSAKLTALIDTGNLLVDPVSNSPVIIVEFDKVEYLVPRDTKNKIVSLMKGDENKYDDVFDTNIKVIPYNSVGNQNGMLISYRVKCVEVEYNDEITVLDDVLIGLYNSKLTNNNKYSALIGLKILERGVLKNESNTIIKNKGKYSIC